MRRDEFITKMEGELNESKARTKEIIMALEALVVDTIKDNDYVPFSFGKIGGKTVPSRAGVNPSTGEKITIPEKKGYPYFKASKKARGKE